MLELSQKEVLRKIGNSMGVFVSANQRAIGRNQMRFAKLLIMVDAFKHLKSKFLQALYRAISPNPSFWRYRGIYPNWRPRWI